MATTDPSPNLQKYGVPIYAAGWVPSNLFRSKSTEEEDSSSAAAADGDGRYHAVLAGGGGEGRTGIPNAVIVSRYELKSNSLSHEPVLQFEIGSDLPYRMAVHSGGDGVVCGLPNACRFFEWDREDNESNNLGLKNSERKFTKLGDIGQQLALAFNNDNTLLAVGGEDGKLRVFKWPSMESVIDEAKAHNSVKDVSFSPDGKFLVSLGSREAGRVWDLTSSAAVASLTKANDEIFASCRFSQTSDHKMVLYTAAITGKGGSIATWNTSSWTRMSSKHIVRDAVSSFDVSSDGKLLAIGTVQGDVLLINSANMKVQMVVKKAHLVMVTALAFSPDSRALLSASMDSSVRVTQVENKKSGGSSSWIIMILIILLAIAAYFMKKEGLLPFLLT